MQCVLQPSSSFSWLGYSWHFSARCCDPEDTFPLLAPGYLQNPSIWGSWSDPSFLSIMYPMLLWLLFSRPEVANLSDLMATAALDHDGRQCTWKRTGPFWHPHLSTAFRISCSSCSTWHIIILQNLAHGIVILSAFIFYSQIPQKRNGSSINWVLVCVSPSLSIHFQ